MTKLDIAATLQDMTNLLARNLKTSLDAANGARIGDLLEEVWASGVNGNGGHERPSTVSPRVGEQVSTGVSLC